MDSTRLLAPIGMCSRRGGPRKGVFTLSLLLLWLLLASLSPGRVTGRTDDDLMNVLDRVAGAGVELQPKPFATRADHGKAPRARIASAFLEFPALLKAVIKQRRKLDVKIKRQRGRGARRRALRDDLLWLEMSIALHLGRLDTAATALKLQKASASSSRVESFTANDLLDLANRLLRLLQGNVLQYMIFREDIQARISLVEFPVMAAAMVTAGGDRNHTEEISTTLAASIVCSLFDDSKILDATSVWPRWNSARFTEMTYAGMLWQTATTGLDCFSDRIFDIGLRAQDKSARNRIATRLPLEIAGVTGRSKLAAAGKSGDESLKLPALATASTYGYVSVVKSMLKRGVCVDDKTYDAVLSHVDIIFSTSMPVLISFGRPCRPKMGRVWTMEEALVRRRAIMKPASDQNMGPSDCDIPVLSSDADLTMAQFLKDYVYAGKPVLVRSALDNQRFSHVVAALSSPETHWGQMEVPSSLIPYPDLFNFGCSGEDTCSGAANRRGTLNAFLEEVDKADEADADNGAAAAPPHYIFTVCTEQQKQLFTERLPHFLEPPAGSPLKPLAIRLCEFYNGGKHSGSPPHWHVSAINVLVRGIKRWFLVPPRFSFHSRTPAKIWWHSESKALWQQENRSLECVQKAGDLLFVPRFWAHAVLNMNPVSGFALEFETPVTRPKAAEPSILRL